MKQVLFFLCFVALFCSCNNSKTPMMIDMLPKGSIIGWASKDNIPKGWALCNGTNGTPNLVERFAVGTANSSEIGTFTGNATHHHSVSGNTEVPNAIFAPNGDDRALQREGGQRHHHTHPFHAVTTEESSIPPATRIIFIMKI